MVFGTSKLQGEVFCLKEERDYFQGKFLEQVSVIDALKEELRIAKNQISKLRGDLLSKHEKGNDNQYSEDESTSKTSVTTSDPQTPESSSTSDDNLEIFDDSVVPPPLLEENSEHEDDEENLQLRETNDDESSCEDDKSDCEDDKSDSADDATALRQNALQLLRWADHCQTSSSSGSLDVPRTIKM